MSNFSNIGFNVTTQEESQQLLARAYSASNPIKVNEGTYAVFTDPSGAALFMQLNGKDEFIGVNPHFKGKSRRTVCLTNALEDAENELDGAFHCWADPSEANNPESGAYPFVFDLPDFKTIGPISFPRNFDIQLTAFAHELYIYENENDYHENQTSELKWAIQSFLPSGLFPSEEEGDEEGQRPLPKASGMFTGIIKQFEKKRNGFTGDEFYWILVDTLGGEVDVVADIEYFEKAPVVNGVVQGAFWLSGQLLDAPKRDLKEHKSFFQRLFGR